MRDGKPFAKHTQTWGKLKCWWNIKCGSRHHERKFFSRQVSDVHLWREWSGDQNDNWKAEVQRWDTYQEPKEPSFSFVEHHQFLDVFLQPLFRPSNQWRSLARGVCGCSARVPMLHIELPARCHLWHSVTLDVSYCVKSFYQRIVSLRRHWRFASWGACAAVWEELKLQPMFYVRYVLLESTHTGNVPLRCQRVSWGGEVALKFESTVQLFWFGFPDSCFRGRIDFRCGWWGRFDVCSDFSSTLHSAPSFVSPIFYFILLIFYFIFHVDRFGVRSLVHFAEWVVCPFGGLRPNEREPTWR